MGTRAEKLIEGFKLGSLGVSKTPKVSSDNIDVVKEGINRLKDDKTDYPYFCWREESDGWGYYIDVEEGIFQNEYLVMFYGGEHLKLMTDTKVFSRYKGWFVPDEEDWRVASYSLPNYDNALSLFKKVVSAVRHEGVDNILSSEFLGEFRVSEAELFKHWLKEKMYGEE
jgi:hypothetical protein